MFRALCYRPSRHHAKAIKASSAESAAKPVNIGVSLTPRVRNAWRSLRPSQSEPAITLAADIMEIRGTSILVADVSRPECFVQNTPPPVASAIGFIFLPVAVTSLISRGSSTPALATAVNGPLGPFVSTL